ncbi:glucosaminidase domain-containing protein [Blautia sp. An249]|uniref:glucosaminidase domain-containing protein n=1 Tax=Blautia sp. An249 TaxID=1965603 RepID=UPI001FA8D187|nr:glucosaminidase domain-containing protein [Blautia sp. An249]
MTKQEFITQIAGYVQKYAPQYEIKCCSAVIAQAILESGWGGSRLAAQYHNYFGLKCGTKWTGPSVNMATQEEYQPGTLTTIKDNFRVYGSMEEGVKGYFEFIQLSRYQNLKGIKDPQTYLETIKADGYATSSNYVANTMAVVNQYNLIQYDKEGLKMSKIEKAIKQMEAWANDSAHGYDQTYRWGEKGDYDCSSAVIQAYENAGVPVKTKGATYTGNMRSVFLQCGFKDVTSKCNLSTGSGLKRGDVLLNTVHHTAMYCGNGKEVEASINEKGTATGGKPGDQTGKEFLIRSYRNYPWNYVLRYEEAELVIDANHWLEKGDTGALVKEVQEDLIYLGFSCGSDGADGEYGDNTVKAVKAAQKAYGLTQDGQYGLKTKNAVDKAVAQKKKEEEANKLQTAVLDKVTFPYIKKGSKGVGVSMLQTMLGTKVTGTFNDDDVKAFKTFQKNTKQSQDGICGENGWKAVAAHMLANTK